MLRRLITRILIIAIIACVALVAGSKGNFAVFWIAMIILLFTPIAMLSSSVVGVLEGDKNAFDIGLDILTLVIAFIVHILVYNVYDTEANNALMHWMFRDEPGPIAWDLKSKEETTDTEDETAESEVESTTNETKETEEKNTKTTTDE